MKNINKVLDILEEIYPDAKCELDYTTPFELLVATILSAQCTDVRVNKVTGEMFKKYNTPKDFANLSIEEIEEEIKSCGLYKSKAEKIKSTSEKIFNEYNGKVPDNLEDLTKLPGVGRKTANVVLSNAFNQDAMAVNTQTPEKTEFSLMDAIPKKRWSHSHHLLIFHGRRICKARKPECGICPITKYCKYYKNNFDKVHS